MTPPAGRRRKSLTDILDQTVPEEATPAAAAPRSLAGSLDTASLDKVATNPLNARDVHARPDRIAELAESLRQFGQMQSSAVATRDAFLAIFPEHADTTAGCEYVQITGARRHAAARIAGLTELNIEVKDHLAASRALWIAATAAENLDRDDYDPIEEAAQVDILVRECRSNKAAAEQLGRSQPWVSQRLNLLLLVDELQAAVRTGEMPVREVRDLHRATPAEQLAALTRWRALVASRKRREEQVDQPDPAPRPVPATATVRFADDPARTAAAWRTRLPADYRRALAEALLRDLDE